MKHSSQRIQTGDLSHHTSPDIPYHKVDKEDSELEELELTRQYSGPLKPWTDVMLARRRAVLRGDPRTECGRARGEMDQHIE